MSRVNGVALEDYKRFEVLETGLAVPKMPDYKRTIANGCAPEDIVLGDLVLYLPLYALKGAGFNSVDRYQHAITITGASWKVNSWYFDGTDDYANAGHPAILNLTDDLTVMAWVNINDKTARMFIVGKDVSGNRGYCYGFVNKKLYGQHSGVELAFGTTALTSGTWYHVAFCYDKSADTVYYYLNGEADGSDTSAGALSSTTTDLLIGRRGYSGNLEEYYGYIGELMIYNAFKSQAEVRQNYYAGIASGRYQ